MPTPEFRNPDKMPLLSFREYIRKHMPSPDDGFVVEDLDLVLRAYQPKQRSRFNFQTDSDGKLRCVELKFGNAWIGIAQQRTFRLMDRLMRLGDPEKKRYFGYFVIQYSCEDWERSSFRVNRQLVDRETFHRFLMFEDIGIAGLFENEPLPPRWY